jgi:hypothetical protein
MCCSFGCITTQTYQAPTTRSLSLGRKGSSTQSLHLASVVQAHEKGPAGEVEGGALRSAPVLGAAPTKTNRRQGGVAARRGGAAASIVMCASGAGESAGPGRSGRSDRPGRRGGWSLGRLAARAMAPPCVAGSPMGLCYVGRGSRRTRAAPGPTGPADGAGPAGPGLQSADSGGGRGREAAAQAEGGVVEPLERRARCAVA